MVIICSLKTRCILQTKVKRSIELRQEGEKRGVVDLIASNYDVGIYWWNWWKTKKGLNSAHPTSESQTTAGVAHEKLCQEPLNDGFLAKNCMGEKGIRRSFRAFKYGWTRSWGIASSETHFLFSKISFLQCSTDQIKRKENSPTETTYLVKRRSCSWTSIISFHRG